MLATLKLEELSLSATCTLIDTRATVLAALVLLLDLRLHRLLRCLSRSQHRPKRGRFLKVFCELGDLSCLDFGCILLFFCSRVGKSVLAFFLAWLYAVIFNECLNALESFVQLISLRQD